MPRATKKKSKNTAHTPATRRAKRRAPERPPAPKRIVYLWGAGATQAEISYSGSKLINLLMRDTEALGIGVASRILRGLSEPAYSQFQTDTGTDIEKLISLLTASPVADHHKLAEDIRERYFADICDGLFRANLLNAPFLATALLELHTNATFLGFERLSGILTTNHDGLLQLASEQVFEGVNLGIPFTSTVLTPLSASSAPPILHLHGSFTWRQGLPLDVAPLHEHSRYTRDTVWIPPTVSKDSKHYPFNKLAGAAFELLSRHCDVLRVVGSSLTQNDWNVLSMLFNAQRHNEHLERASFRIELIMPHEIGRRVASDCSYLKNVVPIGALTDADFAAYKEYADSRTPDSDLPSEMQNPFADWLTRIVTFHHKRGALGDKPLSPSLAVIAGVSP